jgi:DNA/RNA-binding protein KIN17
LKKKAIVIDVENKYTGVVKLIETGSIIKIDQADLETVLPAIGKQLLILNGAYRGEIAILEQINENDFNAKISIASVS